MNYDWVEPDSQKQSDTTTDSYAAVPAVEHTVSLPRVGRANPKALKPSTLNLN